MNIGMDAHYQRHVSELWMQWDRGRQPPQRPGELRLHITVEPPMQGPDTRNQITLFGVPEDFLRVLKANRIPYTEH
jgi:hypothetical protein